MNDSGSTSRISAQARLGLEDALPTLQQRYGAVVICTVVASTAGLAALCGLQTGPEIRPLIPMAATVWALCDLLTAFLLLAQFFVNGMTLCGILSAGYAFTGLLTLPYVAKFPGLFGTGQASVGDQQVSIFLWTIWHCAFPVVVLCATIGTARAKRIASRRKVRILTAAFALTPLSAAALVGSLIIAFRDSLPRLILAGHFEALYREAAVPTIVALNLLACAIVIFRRRRLTALLLWLSVAMFGAALDGLMNLSATRYSYAWDVGKLITVFTSSVVLVMILCDIAGLYARLARLARVDVLTSLQNRRAFEEHLEFIFDNGRRTHGSVALLVVDIDLFKRYNDSFGHLAGDECLQRVAAELVKCATRPLDLVTRFGGEEFVLVLPDTPLHGVLVTAEKVRAVVERLEIVHGEKALGRVTVSVGVAFAPDARDTDERRLFEAADTALFEAKDRGRNRVVLGGGDAQARKPLPPFPAAVTLSSGATSARAE